MVQLWCTYYDVPLSDVSESESDFCADHECYCDDCVYVEEVYSYDDVE